MTGISDQARALRAGIIGCGGISATHMDSLMKLGIPITHVCDILPDRARAAAELTGAQVARDWQSLAREGDVDVVHVLTPHYLHAPMAEFALTQGKHVVLEKPMAMTREEARKLIDTARKSGRGLGAVFQNRLNPSTQEAKRIVQSGGLGPVTGVRASITWRRTREYYQGSGWRGRMDTEGGGLLINQAIHTLDLMTYIAGPATHVRGHISTDIFDDINNVEDGAHATLRYASGAMGFFSGTLGYATDAPVMLEIAMERGTVTLIGDSLRVSDEQGTRDVPLPELVQLSGKAYWGAGHLLYIQDFYDTVAGGGPLPDGESGYAALALTRAIRKSSETGGWESI